MNPSQPWNHRTEAAELLSLDGGDQAVRALLRVFFEQSEELQIFETALAIESLRDARAIPRLIHARLEDPNPGRRIGAARALGQFFRSGPKTARALEQCLMAPAQPLAAREYAAEGLHAIGSSQSVDALLSVIGDPQVSLRFWAAFGLGGWHRRDPRAVRGLESLLDDPEVMPGNWWSVGKEALGMLASIDPYRGRCKAEVSRILADENASREDRNWAGFYGE